MTEISDAERIENALVLAPELRAVFNAAERIFWHCQYADFRNGVTDSTGTVDEGSVYAAEALWDLHRALKAAGVTI